MSASFLLEIFSVMARKKSSSSVVVAFVNGSISKDAFDSPCARFASNMEYTPFGKAYVVMNAGYKRLSEIAYHVETKNEAFLLVGQAFGSVELFFEALENQRLALRSYAQSLVENGGKHWLRGAFLMAVSKQAKGWARNLRLEYELLNSEPTNQREIVS